MLFTAGQILQLFEALNQELEREKCHGEVYLLGGAVLCVALHARAATRDVDAVFKPAQTIRKAAARVAAKHDVPDDWLNDAVKGFISEHGSYVPWLQLSHLKVLTAQPEYLLAMKCLSLRLGSEFHDENDVRFLLRYLNIDSYDRAVQIIARYYPLQRFPPKTLYALEELLGAPAS